jgi:hypothetical protein
MIIDQTYSGSASIVFSVKSRAVTFVSFAYHSLHSDCTHRCLGSRVLYSGEFGSYLRSRGRSYNS